jgi:hypothetical protein
MPKDGLPVIGLSLRYSRIDSSWVLPIARARNREIARPRPWMTKQNSSAAFWVAGARVETFICFRSLRENCARRQLPRWREPWRRGAVKPLGSALADLGPGKAYRASENGQRPTGQLAARSHSGVLIKSSRKPYGIPMRRSTTPSHRICLSLGVGPLARRNDRRRELDPATWPFPAGAWVFLLFWMMVATLAVAYWIFG